MQMLNKFFKEIHNDNIDSMDKIQNISNHTLHESLKAIILSTNQHNFSLFIKSKTFVKICIEFYKECFNKNINNLNINDIKMLQGYILESSEKTQLKNINNFILKLNASDLINNDYTRKLTQFLSEASFNANKDSKTTKKAINLQSLKLELESILKKIYELELSDSIYKELQKLYNNAKQEKFSIGITGVLSAGKSTFLNALLGKEILGSSTVPETANLTVLRYSTNESARVHFWNTKEWEELIESSNNDKSLQNFIQESKDIFGDRLLDYIKDTTQTLDIEIKDLSKFTSANHKSKMYNLVKEVELFTNLEFLQNGVEIVDTPGLDDPITKREEITKGYISNCDLLIHVMNASCAATQIDIDFILETLLVQNVSRLLVILTRIDLISAKDLEESLQYTKDSITLQLKKSQYTGDIQALIDRIDFIPVASFLALLHKTNREQEALKSGYDLKKTNIQIVEEYLDNMLLGENSIKQKDILYIAYKGFLKTINNAKNELELKLLHASDEELEKTIKTLQEENKKLLNSFNKKREEMNAKLEELKKFLQSLQISIEKTIKMEQYKLKDRIYEDAIYGYERGESLKEEYIESAINTALHDYFIDNVRDYKYKISKKISQILLNEIDFTHIKQPQIHFAINKDKLQNSLLILKDVSKLINSHSMRNKNELSLKLDTVFSKSFETFGDMIKIKSKEVEDKFLIYFDKLANAKKEEIQSKIAKQHQIIESTLEKRNTNNKEAIIDSIKNKQKSLYNIANEIDYITHALK